MRILSLLLLLLAWPLLLNAAPTPTGDRSVVVEGYGINPQDALLQAKRAAVENGIGVILTSQTEVENFTLKKDTVITHAVGAVKSFDILQQQQQGDSWLVRIQAVVSLDSITADLMALKILLISMDKPRTMVLVAEEGGKNSESAVIDYLGGKGFELVDPAQAAALLAKEDPFIRQAIDGDPVAAAKLGADNGAEYILVGRVEKSILDNQFLQDNGLRSGQARMTVKVVNASTARVVASKSANAASPHVSPDIAMANAATKVAETLMDDQLFEAIVASFQETINNGANYELLVGGVQSYGQQKEVTRLLEQTAGVVTVTKRRFGGGKLEVSVQFKGSVDSLCEKVDSLPLGDQKILVTEVNGSRVVLQLQAN